VVRVKSLSSAMANSAKLHPVAGIELATVCAGIKKADRRDLVAIKMVPQTAVAAVFTRNEFRAAPVLLAQNHLQTHKPVCLLINTGNANAGTGQQGMADAQESCRQLAQLLQCDEQQVLPFSTGVIGENLPVQKIVAALPALVENLTVDGWEQASHGILTTDTVTKAHSYQIPVADQSITLTGIAKGSGMIRPNMATMLAFIGTDAQIEPTLLQQCLNEAVTQSFNRITVDGDTSTNDACVLMATGRSGVEITADSAAYRLFCDALCRLAQELAKDIVRDGEGATKLITVEVNGGASMQECHDVAYTIAHSPLVKTAMFASDPNWGRILAAVGRSGVTLDINAVEIYLDQVCIVRDGGRSPDYTEAAGQAVMEQNEITVRVALNRGEHSTQVWTCDFSYDYVRINAEYRT